MRSAPFVRRKKDHIRLSLQGENSASNGSGFQYIKLMHSALPELDFSAVDISSRFLNKKLKTPFMVTGMTGGWSGASAINKTIAGACEKQGWIMGVGSQRRQTIHPSMAQSARAIRRAFPRLILAGNIGLSQLIRTKLSVIEELIDSLKANMMVVHTNPLQEALQPEGTPCFAGGMAALSNLCSKCSVPVILKETGCGFSRFHLEALKGAGLFAVDVSGYGGTHFGRIEAQRISPSHPLYGAGEAFKTWGLSTVESLLNGANIPGRDYELWAGGGIQDGCTAAKALAMGAARVGTARLIMQAVLNGGKKEVIRVMARMEYELKIALFCLGCQNIEALQSSKKWAFDLWFKPFEPQLAAGFAGRGGAGKGKGTGTGTSKSKGKGKGKGKGTGTGTSKSKGKGKGKGKNKAAQNSALQKESS